MTSPEIISVELAVSYVSRPESVFRNKAFFIDSKMLKILKHMKNIYTSIFLNLTNLNLLLRDRKGEGMVRTIAVTYFCIALVYRYPILS